MAAAQEAVRAAGCVLWRSVGDGPEVLLVHRPRWSDWSFPKGKLGAYETPLAAAVREVQEETGLCPCLGPRLPDLTHRLSDGRAKVVAYWAARPCGQAHTSATEPEPEVDRSAWLTLPEAHQALTYPGDATLLDALTSEVLASRPLVIVRHAQARDRGGWRGRDSTRPLTGHGRSQATRLAAVLAAYGVRRVLSSDATRCLETVTPYAGPAQGVEVTPTTALSEDGHTPAGVSTLLDTLLADDRGVAMCTHRPVLPLITTALGVQPVSLDPGDIVVVHHAGQDVVAMEGPLPR
ncbi:MAG: NUDIX hydrolase [Nocardioidaceae bacterium]